MSGLEIEKAEKSPKAKSSSVGDQKQSETAIAPAAKQSLEDALRQAALGMAPTAPRLSEGSLMNSQFGGYSKGFSSQKGFKGALSFDMLRQLAWRSPLLSAIVSTRVHQTVRHGRPSSHTRKNEVGYKIVHKRHNDPHFKVPQGYKDLCRDLEAGFEKPWRVIMEDGAMVRDVEPHMTGFLAKVTEDYLVINRPTVELGLDSKRIPRAFGAIDGANLIPTFQVLKYLAAQRKDLPKDFQNNWASYRRALQMVADKFQLHLDERTEWIYLLDGKPVAGFRYDEVIVAPFAPQSDIKSTGYPKSLTERAIFVILAEIMAMTANSRYFEFGSMAESLIALKGNYSDEHIKQIEQIFQANSSGVNGMFKTPLLAMPGGAEDVNVINLKQNHKDMLFDVYIQKLTNLGCAIFRMHPSEINEAPRAGDNSGSLSQSSQTKQIAMAQEQGLETTLMHIKTSIFDPIVERIDPDLMFEWDYGANEQEQLAITEQYKGIGTVNERRQMMGMDPLPKEDPRGEVIDSPTVQQASEMAQQLQQMQEQMQQMQAAQKQPGQPGDTPGGQEGQPGGKPPGGPGGGQPPVAPDKAQDDGNPDDGQDEQDDADSDADAPKPKKKKPKTKGKSNAGIVSKRPWSDDDDKLIRRYAKQS